MTESRRRPPDPETGPETAGTPVLRHTVPVPTQNEDLAADLFFRLSEALDERSMPSALLDSSDHARTARPERSRYSILAFSFGPHAAEVTHRAGKTWLSTPQQTATQAGSFFDWLATHWEPAHRYPRQRHPGPEEPPFMLGWVGWLGYGLKRETGSQDGPATRTEASRAAEPLPPEDARLFRATHAVVLDHLTGTAEVQSLGEDLSWRRQVERTLQECALPDSIGIDPASDFSKPPSGSPRLTGLRVRDSREEYLAMIRAAQEQIRRGNSYEVCLTTSVTARLPEADSHSGFAMFHSLRQRNRAPFTQHLRFPGTAATGATEILSTSPERFLSIGADRLVRSEPIKGTRPRGETPEEDAGLRQDLLDHPKDRAENVMITDLVRNDLSVHAVPSSLRTERLCDVESYPTVHQMVSTVSSRTADGVHPAAVVVAAFPPGSMTGAPKISTMDILEGLETAPRGPYSGVAGFFSSSGAAELSVLIRTAVLTGLRDDSTQDPGAGDPPACFHLGLGGAITADSEEEAEWNEVRTKSAGVLSALGAEFPER